MQIQGAIDIPFSNAERLKEILEELRSILPVKDCLKTRRSYKAPKNGRKNAISIQPCSNFLFGIII